MIKALIIEDEIAAAKRLSKLIREADPSVEILEILDSVSSSIKWLTQNPPPDLMFLDINLGDGQSFSILEQLNIECPVIFTTAYDEYAIKAFKVNSVDYLLKPIKADELKFSIEKYKKNANAGVESDIKSLLKTISQQEKPWKTRFIVSYGDKIKTIEVASVAYFMIIEKSCFLQTFDKVSYGINYSLDQLEDMLDPSAFYRINRRYIISYASIKNMWSYSRSRIKLQLQPVSDEEIIVSTLRSSGFKEWLDK